MAATWAIVPNSKRVERTSLDPALVANLLNDLTATLSGTREERAREKSKLSDVAARNGKMVRSHTPKDSETMTVWFVPKKHR